MILYIARTGKHLDLKDSGPCIDCIRTIKKLKIKRIVYSCDNNIICSCKPDDYKVEHMSLGRKHLAEIS